MALRESDFSEALGSEEPEDFFRRYYPPVKTFFLRRGFSLEESGDLAQETFLRVFKNIQAYRGESSLETWLFQIAYNLYKNTLRSQSTMKREAAEVPLATPEDSESVGLFEDENDPLGQILAGERAQILRKALEELPPQMRQAVMLRVDSDLKYREIAALMHVSIETVKAHLYQARQHLKARLADFFTDEDF